MYITVNPPFAEPPAHPDGVRVVLTADEAIAALRELLAATADRRFVQLPGPMVAHPDDAAGAVVDGMALAAELAAGLALAGCVVPSRTAGYNVLFPGWREVALASFTEK